MIETKHLTKFFGLKTAVDNISFTVDRGEVLGFLGPNAAGKTTTMRMITGFLPPTSGTAIVGGDEDRSGKTPYEYALEAKNLSARLSPWIYKVSKWQYDAFVNDPARAAGIE